MYDSEFGYKAVYPSALNSYRTKGERISEMVHHNRHIESVAVSDPSTIVNIKNICINPYGDTIVYRR
jgi:hypothetical protein